MNHRLRGPAWCGWMVFALLQVVAVSAAPTSTATMTATSTPVLRINEVLAWNTRIANGGTYPDMIELYNAGSATIDLSGKSLSDDPLTPRKYVFPNGTTIAGGAYLVIYADANSAAPGLHTGFALDAEGDQVRLSDTTANGGTLLDSIVFGFQVPDYSVSRTGASANVWALTTPTLGAANASAVVLGDPSAVKLNEWAGKITFRLERDLIELYNTATQPVALGNVRLTDDITRPTRYVIPTLSFIGPNGFLPLWGGGGGSYTFGFDGDFEVLSLLGDNNEQIDQVTIIAQPQDQSAGRVPDGGPTMLPLTVPTPGMSNSTVLPAAYFALLNNLRITELMYDPVAANTPSDFEFVELQNIGTTPLDLSGVRFTNGIDYTFPSGTILNGGAFAVVVKNRAAFMSRYPGSGGVVAPGEYVGALDNSGETISLTLPAPWQVNILKFRYESTWYSSTAGGGYSLVVNAPATTPPQNWGVRSTWSPSSAVNGNPGAADPAAQPPPTTVTARLSNLSVRTTLASGQTLIVGFVVSGGPRNILVRAAGPALATFGLNGFMTDPRLELYNGATLVFQNDNWPAALADVFQSVGAFSFAPGSNDAALVQSVDGPRSVQARGTGPGLVLVEAYDTGAGNSPRLINLSARNRVGTGDDILIAGFTLSGTGAKSLLIRAVGPGLATSFNVPGTLADPKLELYNGSTKLNENDNWNATLASTFTSVGAFALDAGSRDAALLTSLAPGSYTVQVRGADGGTGEALVEIYEVP